MDRATDQDPRMHTGKIKTGLLNGINWDDPGTFLSLLLTTDSWALKKNNNLAQILDRVNADLVNLGFRIIVSLWITDCQKNSLWVAMKNFLIYVSHKQIKWNQYIIKSDRWLCS